MASISVAPLVEEHGTAMVEAAFENVDPSRGVQATIRDSISALWSWYQDNMALYSTWEPIDPDLGEQLQHRLEGLLEERLRVALEAEPGELPVTADQLVRFIVHRFDGLAFGFRMTCAGGR